MHRFFDWLKRLLGWAPRSTTSPAPPSRPVIVFEPVLPPAPLNPSQFGVSLHRIDNDVLLWCERARISHARVTCYVRNMSDPRRHDSLGGMTVAERFYTDVRTLHENGIEPLVVFHTSDDNDPGGNNLPAIITAIVRNAAGAIGSVQLLNEMNLPESGFTPVLSGATQRDRGQRYGYLLNELNHLLTFSGVRRAIDLVVGGCVGDPTSFLQGVIDVAPSSFDAVAVHCYGEPANSLRAYATSARKVLNDRAVPFARVYATEVGSERGRAIFAAGDFAQRNDMRDVLDVMQYSAQPPVDRLYWYCAYTDVDESGNLLTSSRAEIGIAHDRDGLLNAPNYSERPAAIELRERLNAQSIVARASA